MRHDCYYNIFDDPAQFVYQINDILTTNTIIKNLIPGLDYQFNNNGEIMHLHWWENEKNNINN
mgnify:CR=1 FL=1